MKAYAFLKGSGILIFLCGCLALLEYLSSQFRGGSGSQFSLVGGAYLVGFGIVLAMLGDLGSRVIGIQEKLGALPEEDRLFKDKHQP